MENTIKLLASIAEELDNQGLAVLASKVDAVANNALSIKTAQYIGIQGYAIRNSRCWANCYRKKRVETPTKAAQVVWTECHKEYVASINNDGSKWDKYADSNESFVKMASIPENTYKEVDKKVIEFISKKTTSGLDLGNAIFSSLDELANSPQEKAIASSNELLNIAEQLVSKPEFAKKLSEASQSLLKDAGFFDGIGKAVGDKWNGMKFDYNVGNQLGDVDKSVKNVVQALTAMESSKQKLAAFLQGFKPKTPQQQQSLQTAMQGMQGFNMVNPATVQAKWDKIKQAITMGTGGSTPAGAVPSAGSAPGATPAGAASATPGAAPATPATPGAAPAANPQAPAAAPVAAPKGNNVPMPPDVKEYLSKIPMKQLQRIINDAKHMRTAYNASQIKESQIPPAEAATPAAPAPPAGKGAQPRQIKDQIHFLRGLPPNVREFLEGLNANQLQAVLNDLEAEKHSWASVDKRRNFVR